METVPLTGGEAKPQSTKEEKQHKLTEKNEIIILGLLLLIIIIRLNSTTTTTTTTTTNTTNNNNNNNNNIIINNNNNCYNLYKEPMSWQVGGPGSHCPDKLHTLLALPISLNPESHQ